MQLPSGVLPLMVLSEFGETSAILITLESESLTYRSLEKELGRLERICVSFHCFKYKKLRTPKRAIELIP